MPYPMQFRIAVARHNEESGSSIETGLAMGCSESWCRDLIKRQRESGSLDVLPSTRKYELKLEGDDLEQLARLIEEKPDLTLGELAAALENKASVTTVWRATKKLGYSLKKDRPRLGAGPTGRKARAKTVARVVRGCAGGSTRFHRRIRLCDQYEPIPCAESSRERVVCHTPAGHWKVLSTIAAMTTRGMVCCGTFDGATDTDTFIGFITELAKVIEPGQVVVMDNLSAHRPSKIDELIEAAGG